MTDHLPLIYDLDDLEPGDRRDVEAVRELQTDLSDTQSQLDALAGECPDIIAKLARRRDALNRLITDKMGELRRRLAAA
ncbi:hypothetical protein [Sphingosinicella sp. BN140058]|uniref:hypothetical protein n=1 Tax=Sphingosinicella sp. BN140058 TaxID=1892855 RepID=UPI001010D48F|nr:hypothetical protein [Sphingosinicella sp. BN140058]QAY80354.1 hypothetical protein ETR14_27315 [Sphingosinicella sp. BN140058]